jgi:hypothetical protein
VSHHANSRNRYLSIFEACDLRRGLDRGLFGDCCHGAKSGRLGWGLDTIKAIMIAFELLNHGQSGVRLKAK